MVADSCSGDLWALYAGPLATSIVEYKHHWQAIADLMPAKARAANGKNSNNLNRIRHIAFDPECWLAAEIDALDLPPQAGAGKTTSKGEKGSRDGNPAQRSDLLRTSGRPAAPRLC